MRNFNNTKSHRLKTDITKSFLLLLFLVLITSIAISLLGCGRSEENSALRYTVLQETPLEGGATRGHIWVSDTLSKVEAMTIAMGLMQKYEEFLIYDSRIAFERRLDPEYPYEEFKRHLWIWRKKGEKPEWVRLE